VQLHSGSAENVLQLSWCKEGGEHKQVPGFGFWCKSRNYSTGMEKAASDLRQDSSNQCMVFSIHFAASLSRAAEFQGAAVEC